MRRYRDWSLRAKMGALLLLASALPVAVAALVEFRIARNVIREGAVNLLRARADEVAGAIDVFHRGYQQPAARLARVPALRSLLEAKDTDRARAAPGLQAGLRAYVENDPNFRGLGVFDRSGTVIVATEAPLVGRNHAFRGYFQEALRGAPATSSVYIAVPEVGSVPSIAYAAPVLGDSGAVLGVVALWVRAEALWHMVRKRNGNAGNDSYSVVLDAEGIRIAHSADPRLVFRPTTTLAPAVIDALVTERRFGARTRELLSSPALFPEAFDRAHMDVVLDTPFRRFAPLDRRFTPTDGRWTLGVARRLQTVAWTLFYLAPEETIEAPAVGLVRQTALASALIIVLALAGGLVFAGRIARPMVQVAQGAEALAAGDLGVRIAVRSGGEARRLGDSFNRMAAALAAAHDDLERKVLERTAELHRQKAILDSVVNSMGQGVVVADEAGRFLLFNPMAERLLGLGAVAATPDEWSRQYGVFRLDGVTPVPTSELPLVRAMRGEDVDQVELLVRNPHAPQPVPLSLTGRPLRDAGGAIRGGVVVFHDVTERKRAEEALRDANKELEAFTYSVSHDLRAPVRHIAGFADMLRRRSGATLDETGRRHLQTVIDAAGRMGQLIDDLLAFSRMGREEIRGIAVDVAAVVREVRAELAPETAGRAIEWRIEAPARVHADPALLRVVLQNLVGNAVKYTRGRECARIEVLSEEDGAGQAVITVRDDGAGFDMAYADKLFGVFQRLHRAEEFEGTGIGLATVARIVARHGGRVWAEGRVGEGAAFHFTLPLVREEGHDGPEADPDGGGQPAGRGDDLVGARRAQPGQ